MKMILIPLFALMFLVITSNAQEEGIAKKSKDIAESGVTLLSGGVGLGVSGTYFNLDLQYFVTSRFSIGGILSRGALESHVQLNYTYTFDQRTVTMVGFKSEYQYGDYSILDPYVSAMLGHATIKYVDVKDQHKNGTLVVIAADIGGRVYLSSAIALYGAINLGPGGLVKGGITIKF